MSITHRGLYETLITEALDKALGALGKELDASRGKLDAVDAGDRIALHIGQILRRIIDATPENDRTEYGIKLARYILDTLILHPSAKSDLQPERPLEPGLLLNKIARRLPDGSAESIEAPLIPLLDTTLLTHSPGDPNLERQLLAEIQSADRIDLVVAFIRFSGIRNLQQALRKHCDAGRELRVLTTTYTRSTEESALEVLKSLGAQIRVSYDTSSTRLHAKAWLFHRRSGFSTAYIGSSNLTHSAQVSGLEWNVRVSGVRNPDVINKITAVFDSYWLSPDFKAYDLEEFRHRSEAETFGGITNYLPPTDLLLHPFQERLLEQIALSRQSGFHRNLLVSATGTGKTVMAAIDYVRLRSKLPRSRLLFVAHREEILKQSLATFRHALRDATFGELWVSGERPHDFDHVFASIQSLNATRLAHLEADHFDMVIIDEFHHGAAPSYRTLLNYLQPVELLALTATPERTDGLPILDWFGGRIAAELRLWDAIEQQQLAPFAYYGIHDGLDLREIPWKRGSGYDTEKLTELLTRDMELAHLIIQQLSRHVGNLATIRALGFCVSVAHARFMADAFSAAGLPAVAIWSDSPSSERHKALKDLADGRIRVVFSVDIFNEGIDVPSVDTLLLLRPTDSPTLFIQQLGRGLRKTREKGVCTVLDFVGLHRKEFRFDRRLLALLGGTRKELEAKISEDFPFLPAGCYFNLDRIAKEIVLQNLRAAIPSRQDRIDALVAASTSSGNCTLQQYLDASGFELDEIYDNGRSWSDLRADAGLRVEPSGPHEEFLRRAIGRLLHIDDLIRIDTYRKLLSSDAPPDPRSLPEREQRLLRMLVTSLVDEVAPSRTSLSAGIELVWKHPQVRCELLELLSVLATRVNHLTVHASGHPDVPLEIHARYTRLEILTAFGVGEGVTVARWVTGARFAKEAQADLLAFTLDKTSGKFSPRTRYGDYAIDPYHIHWESQNTTRADSERGKRYQEHVKMGTSIMLFARNNPSERAFYFLGPATYVKHESEQPMAIVWRLDEPLPGDLFAAFAAAVA